MVDLINKILFYIKVVLLLIVFSLSLYILLIMGEKLNNSLGIIISVFIPMLLVLTVFVVSFFFQEGNKNILFNVASCFAFLAILLICFRTILDKNMVLWYKDKINFYFFRSQIRQIKVFCYLIFVGNILLILKEKGQRKSGLNEITSNKK